jgi:hypothetical protein
LKPSFLRLQQTLTTSEDLRALRVSNLGKKMARPMQEIAMVITDNHTTSTVAISSLESPIDIYLKPVGVC